MEKLQEKKSKKLKLPLDPLSLLVRWSNQQAGYYGHPVYLVGSHLNPDKPNPRDIDLVCIIPDYEFQMRYGVKDVEQWILRQLCGMYTDEHWRWCRDVSKRNISGMEWCQANIDFKVIPQMLENRSYSMNPKEKISTNPEVLVPVHNIHAAWHQL